MSFFLNITDCEFSNNYAIAVPESEDEPPKTGHGGAISTIMNCNMNIKNSNFVQNNADNSGGAIYSGDIWERNFKISDSNFTENKASDGGAIYAAYLDVDNSNFINNVAIYYGGAITSEYDAILNVRKSSFKFNGGDSGGAISFGGSANISDSVFINNSAKHEGGAILASGFDEKMNIVNSNFFKNSASDGGAIYFNFIVQEFSGFYKPERFNSPGFTGKIRNSVFESNTARNSGGTISQLPENIKLSDNTFENNNLEEVYLKYASFKTTHGSGKVFKVTVISQTTNKPVPNVKVTLTLLRSMVGTNIKKLYATTDSKGVASFKSISNVRANYYIAGHVFNLKGCGGYIDDGGRIVIQVPTIVKAPKVTFNQGRLKYFKVTVKNKETKKLVNDVKVKIKVFTGKKFKTYTIKTNKKGMAKLNTKTLKRGTHKVEISSGNENYKISAKSTIIIK